MAECASMVKTATYFASENTNSAIFRLGLLGMLQLQIYQMFLKL